MDKETIQTNLQTVKSLVLDEQKLVTYITLSKELCIHVNDAKTLLSLAVEDIRKTQTNTSLNINYIISGLINNNSARTTVCSEADVVTLRSTFRIVFYQHIYSICQGSHSVDNIAFVAINNFEDFPLCTGLIKGTSCLKRTLDDLGKLKSNEQESVDETKSVNLPTVKKESKKDLAKSTFVEVKKINETKLEPIIKLETISPKKDLASTSNGKTTNTKTVKKGSGIAGFFNKSNACSSTKPNTKVEKTTIQENKVKTEIEEAKVEHMDVDNEVPDIKEPKTKEMVKKKHSLNQIRKNAKVDKKRKRVLCVSDSDSENEKNDPFAEEQPASVDHESEDEIPPTPSANTVKITSGILNPKKRRKIVDKTYTDEDGYILTRKEEIYESCSENEEELVHTKENVESVNVIKTEIVVAPKDNLKSDMNTKDKKSKTKKKISPPKGKQATLMNFFKKV